MEMYTEAEHAIEPAPANTATTLIFLAAFAIIVSWLVCFAVPNVLVSANLMSAWPPGADPRPQWMSKAFIGVFAGSAFLGLCFRWLSLRQLRRIDRMADE
jgi:hypothetical protein